VGLGAAVQEENPTGIPLLNRLAGKKMIFFSLSLIKI
jgi:hypothetical protein